MRDGQKDNRRWKNRSITDMTNTTHICLNGAYKVDTMKLFYASYMQIVEFCNPEYRVTQNVNPHSMTQWK